MISLINILSIFNLFALAFLIGVRKQNTRANQILGLSLVCSATDFVVNFLSYSGLLDDFPYIVFLNFSFLWAPLVLFYVALMLEIKWKFDYKHLTHLIPQLLSWIYWIHVFTQGEDYLNVLLADRKAGNYTWQMQSFQIIIIIQAIAYLGYSIYRIYNYQSEVNYPQLPEFKIQWLKQFILVLSGLIFALIILSFIVPPVTIDYIVAPILYGLSNIFLIYRSLGTSGILVATSVDETPIASVPKERYTGSNLKPEQIEHYKAQLLKHLQVAEPYTNPDLTLNHLSAQTDIQAHHLSQVINQEFNKNFFDLINSYRIEKSKTLMMDVKTANLTLEAIGLESGFGSASSFYRSFKKHTGITPKAFLKAQNTGGLEF